MAKKLGKEEDYKEFSKRAENYRNLFDSKTKFMRTKLSEGSFREPFDPYQSKATKYGRDFTEANSWQYSLFVPGYSPK